MYTVVSATIRYHMVPDYTVVSATIRNHMVLYVHSGQCYY